MPNEVSLMVSAEGLTALADMALAPKNQSNLDDLLARNAERPMRAWNFACFIHNMIAGLITLIGR